MANQLEDFITYVLDTETTSELLFTQTLRKNATIFRNSSIKTWQNRIERELKEIGQNANRKDVRTVEETVAGDESDEKSSSDIETESDEENETKIEQKPATKTLIDPIRRADRLLRLLFEGSGENVDLFDIYFNTLETLIQLDDENLRTIALKQIVSHVFERAKDSNRFERLITLKTSSSIVDVFRHFSMENSLQVEHLEILFPTSGRFVDARREFRDSTKFFLDIDSLLLALIHQDEIDASPLHLIFVVERILFKLFQQANETNFTLIFFDFYEQIYEENSSILLLIRSALVAHLKSNDDRIEMKQFSSWLDDEYVKFVREEKIHFVFYHDLSNLKISTKNYLSNEVFERLTILSHLFGNFHQYFLECQLFLLNKIFLSPTTVECFQLKFFRLCPLTLLQRIFPKNDRENVRDDQNFVSMNDEDVRFSIYFDAISQLIDKDLATLFSLHVSLLVRLSITDRHLSTRPTRFEWKFDEELENFEKILAKSIAKVSSKDKTQKIGDIFDRRLFFFTIEQIAEKRSAFRLDSTTKSFLQRIFQIEISDFSPLVDRLIKSQKVQVEQKSNDENHHSSLIRISNPLIDKFTGIVLNSNQLEFVEPEENLLSSFSDRQIWNEMKEVGDDISRIPDNLENDKKKQPHRFRTRNQQKLFDYFTLYGESLTTRDVQDRQYRIILPKIVEETTTSATATAKNEKTKAKAKTKTTKSKADDIREQNLKRKAEKRDDEETLRLDIIDQQVQKIPPTDLPTIIDLLDESLPTFKSSNVRLEILQRKFDYQRKYLRTFRRKSSLTIEEQSKLELLRISYFATLCELIDIENISNPFEVKMKFMEDLLGQSSVTKNDWYRFQLETINSRLPRRETNSFDPRVPEFLPDPWQVKFLDAVDREDSIVIVAPTASGKTYSSYYAMQQAQKKSSNGVCVYIAPSKALINQVAGTIYTNCGPNLGVFTSDYRMNITKCRILVTTPECFEMLLLSAEYQRWCQRIRYCIFDEIHCMSGELGSEVWERIILLINCPMIGLSATVKNGEEVQHWIEKVEEQRKILFKNSERRRVVFIDQKERLADLNKFLYSNRQLIPLHPVSLFNSKQLIHRGLPDDLAFSPAETLCLHDKLTDEKNPPAVDTFFSPDWVVERTRANEFSKTVRQPFEKLIEQKNLTKIDEICTFNEQIEYPEMKPMATLIGEFVLTLKEKNLLPCIIFTDSRTLCEDLAESVTKYFENLEEELRRTKYKRQIEAIEKRIEMIEKAERKTSKTKKASAASSKRRGEDDEATTEDKPADLRKMDEEDQNSLRLTGYENELLNGTLEEATLANLRGCNRELKERLLKRASKRNPRLIRYINRGVAYHHPRLRNIERLAVEGLFRNRYVQLIFSTWTLALGVHMPTRTVAFVKDSMSLDALQYRQSSGRSGRRGFDVQGNVVFLDIPLSKIRHLTVSSIPDIRTDLSISVTYLMRLLNFYNRSEDKDDALNRSLVSMQCPFVRQYRKTMAESIDDVMRYHCLSTVDLLYRLNLLDEHGNLIGLAGLAMHLHCAEPANLLFTYLIDMKLFHRLSDDEELINLLAYLFTHRTWFITRDQSRRERYFNKKRSLRPLSKEILRRIHSYNDVVRQSLGVYLENLLRHLRSVYKNVEESLPFSQISFSQSTDYDDGTFEYQLHHHHSEQKNNPSISPFAGLSGLTHGELLRRYSPSINTWHLPFDLDLSSRIVPMIDIDAIDSNGSSYYLNSYLVDFFRHGSETKLINEYDIERDEVYQLLRGFQSILYSIDQSLRKLSAENSNDNEFFRPISKKFTRLEQTFSRRFHSEYK